MRYSQRSLWGLVVLVLVISGASQWWSGRAERRVAEQVAALAKVGDIRMLSSDSCAFCAQARGWFTANGVPFSECSIERDAACRAAFEATRAPGTPVMVVRGATMLGFSPARLRELLQRAG